MGEKRHAYRALVGKPEGKRRLERPRVECDVKTDLEDIGWTPMDWIFLVAISTNRGLF
jgi:hypothetical protein